MLHADISAFLVKTRRCWRAAALVTVAAASTLVTLSPAASAQEPVDLGVARSFAVFGGASVDNRHGTRVTGNLGVSPGSLVTGFPPGVIDGERHPGDATAAAVRADLVEAYNDMETRLPTGSLPQQLGGTTRGPGVYDSLTDGFNIDGSLTLDAQGDPDAVFIFRAETLVTARVSNISLIRGAKSENVFWQLSHSARIGVYSTFRGTLIAEDWAAVDFGANVIGRVAALIHSVTITGTESTPVTRIGLPNEPPTITRLSSEPNPSLLGQPVTFTAEVDPVTGTLVPQGEVLLKRRSVVLGATFLDAAGRATFTISNLARGQHRIVAVYLGGDTFEGEDPVHFSGSTSQPVFQIVQLA
ncbi:ice-binding family protein [Nonomuraea lactucae]|uniref:ice-binding family protein n=1 Tax=Nonomuraea lactucae TaxID=2249762 RepID=UPI000DE4009A|nr:ice-binding family protein [Nonomuraea lactucae]